MDDLARIEDEAVDQDTTPERLAYRWRDQPAWYDPDEKSDLHLMHWRFVMRHRATFFDLAVYAPTDASSARRKQKTLACQARLLFISRNIEEFGYYGFLDLFENSAHDHLMWLGGKAAKHSLDAKKAKKKDDAADPPQKDLAKLLRRGPSHYERVIERVLDPDTVDEEGYTSIPELLTKSHALDPTRPAHLRLPTHALARIVVDVTDIGAPLNPNWVGNRTTGPWKKLFSDVSILAAVPKLRVRLNKGRYVAKYDHKDFVRSEAARRRLRLRRRRAAHDQAPYSAGRSRPRSATRPHRPHRQQRRRRRRQHGHHQDGQQPRQQDGQELQVKSLSHLFFSFSNSQ
jgi:hypothetical protein